MTQKQTQMLAQTPRAPWTPPVLTRLASAAAKAGPNPLRPEGAFASGS